MGKSKLFAIALFAGLFLCLFSCSDDSTSPSSSDPTKLTATISGAVNKNFVANFIDSDEDMYNGVESAVYSGSVNSKDSIRICINDIKVGPFAYDQTGGRATISYFYYTNNKYVQYDMAVVSVSVTERNDSFTQATFSGKTAGNPGDAGYLEINNGIFVFKKEIVFPAK